MPRATPGIGGVHPFVRVVVTESLALLLLFPDGVLMLIVHCTSGDCL
jgi:hypothetical protein